MRIGAYQNGIHPREGSQQRKTNSKPNDVSDLCRFLISATCLAKSHCRIRRKLLLLKDKSELEGSL